MTLASTILALNPIAYWKLDETSGTVATNYGSLGAAANGTYSGATLNQVNAPGGGKAPLFDGVNDAVSIPIAGIAPLLNPNDTTYTVMAWWKVFEQSCWEDATARQVLSLMKDTGNKHYFLKTATNNTFNYAYAGTSRQETTDTTAYNNTIWHMSLMTINGTTEAKFYIDNSLLETHTSILAFNGNITSFTLGRYSAVASNWWNGCISHSAIFTSVLTAEEIAAIYNAGIAQAYSITADAASIAVTGQDATLTAYLKKLGCVTAADTSLYTVTASDTCLYTVTASDMRCT